MPEQELRRETLQQALFYNNNDGMTAEEVVEVAELFYDFLAGKDKPMENENE